MPACSNCSQDNPANAKFCLNCGSPLAAPPAKGEERKIVSVLFADLVGFTAASESADPEDVRARLRPYHQKLKELIEARGGTVEKFIGDAVVGLFGAPIAHEDDAERAVRAALRIQQAIEELNQADPTLGLSARAAVNTGEVVVALGARPELGEGMVTGDVVNTASRLQGVAPVGGVAVGETTYRLTKDLFDYEELEAVSVKGKSDPVRLWWAKSPRAKFGVETDTRPSTPFVGRKYEMTMMENLYWRTTREQSIQLATLMGEPGVGKTRLLAEFSDFVDDLAEIVQWRQGRCLPYGEGITFWALGEVVKAQAGILESDTPAEAGDKLAAALALLIQDETERDWVRARLAPLVGAAIQLDSTVERTEAFTAWRRFLEALSEHRTTIVVFEDLHWADAAMLDFIEHLVDWASNVPLMVICTARPELYDSHPGWGGGKRNSSTLNLSPLTKEETSELIAGLLEETELPEKLTAMVVERSGGNPLYAEEFVRMLFDQGVIAHEDGQLRVTGALDVSVPDSVHALIAARLDTVPAERKALLQDAAVVGKVFWSGAVATMGAMAEDAARNQLHDLARREIVRPARISTVKDQSEYAFWHVLVRDVAYGQIPRGSRAQKHRAAAEWIEQTAGDRVADQAELLAYHYEQALELARASGQSADIPYLEQRARHFFELAGDRARVLDMASASRYYTRALELASDDDPKRLELVQKVSFSVGQTQGPGPTIPMLRKEAERFRSRGDDLGLGAVLVRLSTGLHMEGDAAEGETLSDEGLRLLESQPPGRQLADAYVLLAGQRLIAGESAAAKELAEHAIDLGTKLQLDSAVARALGFRGGARCDLGDPGGIEDLRSCLDLVLQRGETDAAGSAYINLGDAVWVDEGPVEGLKVHREGIEFCRRRGAISSAMWGTAESAWMLYDTGEWDDVIAASDEVAAWVETGGTGAAGLVAPAFKARVQLLRGNVAASGQAIQDLLPKVRRVRDTQVLAPALITAALWELAAKNTTRAVHLVNEFIETSRNVSVFVCWQLPDAARILTAAGETGALARIIEAVRPGLTRDRLALAAVHPILREATGDLVDALSGYLEAASGWESYPFPFEQAQALFGAARCLIGLGRANEAAPHLEKARAIFGSLGALPLVGEVDALEP
ncbi:MAG TPA: adenylate/guanylate cyclase domain-containing protein [Actinomycetota bacterium]|nr:adenylate/guanylate cyclase domain-containing protein [Actinomycetota bacterium]